MTETMGSTATPEHDGRGEKSDDGKGGRRRDRRKLGPLGRFALFNRQIVAELRKVVWPKKQELRQYTTVVIVFVIVMIGLVYGIDYGFSKLTFWIFG
ncbi:preprotein translocase subunit SecE [Mangrovactinospora gilvigrisea]|uniref:Protein translocase subunit SecE n=1 Tax=Mangrovactinospora gilvigrisea TaxID=1428644 RepID=A0A1J7CCD2_9ACTN|nr:preprotein translocase subunit SecE [Mangrovactinospora gilvigrisea]OIV39188.1 preprotein translocase subunit SecE [Mangrovactinospora gilvigrisea]